MKHINLYIVLLILIYSCNNSNSGEYLLESTRKKYKKEAEEFNSFQAKREKFIDSLYKIAELNLDSGIIAIDKVILEAPNYSPYYKIKGDFYFKYREYQNAKVNYSKALELESFSNATVFRASCYLNLKQYDSCLIDLKSFPEFNKSNYWYIGNYYETRLRVDSAVLYYEMLFKVDNGVYKYCNDRIDYLRKNPNPKLYKELILRDTARWIIRLN